MENKIFETLKMLNLTSAETRQLYSKGTRDNKDIEVWKDSLSGVLFIDGYFVGNEEYSKGAYRTEKANKLSTGRPDVERYKDVERRTTNYQQFFIGKNVGDFGCGSGDFLKRVKPLCESVVGLELQKDYVDQLNSEGIRCVDQLTGIQKQSLDVLFAFHVLEHLPDPVRTLRQWMELVASKGKVIIEVPHANDFLLTEAFPDEFMRFTLWSQHLILHTRESLYRMLQHVGLKNIRIEGVQRYPLSNHLHWLGTGKPGGHKSSLAIIDSPQLSQAYASSLARIDATDTLVAIAEI